MLNIPTQLDFTIMGLVILVGAIADVTAHWVAYRIRRSRSVSSEHGTKDTAT